MIREVFTHCPGIGPKTEQKIKKLGCQNWDDCIKGGLPLSAEKKKRLMETLRLSREALENGDIGFFVSRFPVREHWRVLREYFSAATFFDIETTGLYWYESHATVITAFHRGALRTFVYGRNLDDFLLLLDESDLLVSFNGGCFDIPFIEHTFNIPSVGRPHIDLRWVAHHAGFRGGLKSIEKSLGIRRPSEVEGIDGLEAVNLFYRWQAGDDASLKTLIRYCSADVAAAYLVAQKLIGAGRKKIQAFGHDEIFAKAMDAG